MSLFVYSGLVLLFTLSSDSQYSQNLNVHIFLTSWKIFWEFKSSNISSSLLFLSFLPELPPYTYSVQFSSVQSLSHVWLFVNPWITACQAFLSIINSWSLLKLKFIESVMPSSHLILCRPLLLLPPIPPSIRVFSNKSTLRMRWPKYWSFSFSISPSNEHIRPSQTTFHVLITFKLFTFLFLHNIFQVLS